MASQTSDAHVASGLMPSTAPRAASAVGSPLQCSASTPAFVSGPASEKALELVPDNKDAQVGLLTAASEEKTADEVKISLYKSLATNAKLFGSQLETAQIEPLNKTVAEAANNDVRAAAAEAHGALNLPADQAKSLILAQFKH